MMISMKEVGAAEWEHVTQASFVDWARGRATGKLGTFGTFTNEFIGFTFECFVYTNGLGNPWMIQLGDRWDEFKYAHDWFMKIMEPLTNDSNRHCEPVSKQADNTEGSERSY